MTRNIAFKCWLLALIICVLMVFLIISTSPTQVSLAMETQAENEEKIADNNLISEENNLVYEQGKGESIQSNKPKNDDEKEININSVPLSNFTDVNMIPNSLYFIKNPRHAEDDGSKVTGTCTTIAMQLLMGYHNYYSDRRLIPEMKSNGERFLCEDYGFLESSPLIVQGDNGVRSLGIKEIGTEDTLYSELLSRTTDQTLWMVKNAANDFLVDYSSAIRDSVNIRYESYSQELAISEINNGRPTILGFQPVGTPASTFHVVVAYGYAKYNGADGFIVHYGHYGDKTQIWVPESYFGYQITMEVNHEHSFTYDNSCFRNDGCLVKRCSVCGCENLYPIFKLDNNGIITKLEYNIPQGLNIPKILYDIKVTGIGNAVFANQTGITTVSISADLNSIGANAFEGCTSLKSISLPTELTSIGNAAFYGCSSLTAINIPLGVKEIGANTFQNCTSLATLIFDSSSLLQTIGNSAFQNCTSLLSVAFPKEMYSIGYNAFYGCSGLVQISFKGEAVLGVLNAAFANCTSLKSFEMPPQIRLGYDAFNGCTALESVTLSTLITMDDNAFANCPNLTIYTGEHTAGVDKLKQLDCTVVSNCGYSDDFKYIVSLNTSQIRYNTANTISNPTRAGYSFGGWYTTADFSGTKYDDIASAPNGTLYAKWNESACVAAGTLITLADGRQVPVESLTGNEMLLVWNLFTGEFDVAPILFIDSEAAGMYEVVTLAFSDGTTLKVIDEHALWDFDLNEYVFMRSDAAKYIGHWFNKQSYDADGNMIYTRVQLTGVTVTTEYTSAWSPVTYGHLCFYVNGMLSMPGATTGLINIFDVDPDTMTIDEEQYLADIAQYGLFTYDEFAALYPVPEEIFDAFGGQYLKVAMGKGILTEEMISALIVKYSEFF